MSELDVQAIRARARGEDLDGERRYLRYDILALCDEVERLRAVVAEVETVVESPFWGTYWGEVMVPQPRLRGALQKGVDR